MDSIGYNLLRYFMYNIADGMQLERLIRYHNALCCILNGMYFAWCLMLFWHTIGWHLLKYCGMLHCNVIQKFKLIICYAIV